jgi:hypothetical protein
MSYSNGTNGNGGVARNAWKTAVVANGLAASIHAPDNIVIPSSRIGGDGGSPTLPNLATQPTLNSLINSSLSSDVIVDSHEAASPATSDHSSVVPSGAVSSADDVSPSSIAAAVLPVQPAEHTTTATPPRIGDAGRRMMGAALGLKHPGISPRRSVDSGETLQKAMGGLVIAE